MKKLNSIFMLALFLIILPAGSWLYLKKGFNYRKQIMEELETKTPLKTVLLTKDSSIISLKNKCTLLSLSQNEKHLKDIYRQFKEARGFQLVANLNNEVFKSEYKKSNAEIESLINNSYKQLDSVQFHELILQYKNTDFVLIDSLSQIRNTYTANDMANLISHIPPLLPYFDEKKMK